VVELRSALGLQLSVEFDPAEKIENVAIGDSLGWQVTPNRRANLLFLKPMSARPPTNMTVITNLRRYNFQLSVQRQAGRAIPFSVRFLYAEPVWP
jgi:type IV secretion system protein VirB9